MDNAETGRELTANSCLKSPHTDPTLEAVFDKCSPCPITGCWHYMGAVDKKGYGRFDRMLAHRVAAKAAGLISQTWLVAHNENVLHSCDNPSCCNPAHLRAGTLSDNMQDCSKRGRLRSQKR